MRCSAPGTSPISEKIAFLAEEGPYRRAVFALEGLMPAELRLFPAGAVEQAKAWLAQ